MEKIDIIASRKEILNHCRIEQFDVFFIRCHRVQSTVIKRIGKVDRIIIFTKQTGVVQIAGSISYSVFRVDDQFVFFVKNEKGNECEKSNHGAKNDQKDPSVFMKKEVF